MTKQQNKLIKHWLISAGEDQKTAKDLFKLKHYGWSLFLYHLSIEKLLKAHLVKKDKKVIFVHDLVYLANLAKIGFNREQEEYLQEISTYNIKARYDIEKMDFHKKADKNYTSQWIKNCEKIYKWFKEEL